ncbi:SGNH/GDSL hydrolase family protein [Mycobacterium sp. UM_Kg1]|uniref:SGNH/GDSL hydrolase family protein n=1 Tax=Mycobacterium sp. UM_Kg1 TaxID=1545691 RepID=UPI0009E5F5C2|nr:SGNH/GDSL hydrolase family protein [Mycobacterium sp. UM_Kg1]
MMRSVGALLLTLAVLVAACAGQTPPPKPSTGALSPATETASRTPAGALQAVVIGDEFAAGIMAGGFGSKNWPASLQRRAGQSGVDAYFRNFSRGGAGYTVTVPSSPTFGEQVTRGVNHDTNLVLLAGGANDVNSLPALHDAAVATLDHVKSIAPRAGMLIVGPSWYRREPPNEAILAARDSIRDAAAEAGAPFIDPIAEDWFAGDDRLASPDHLQLSHAGQQVVADRLAQPVIDALRQQHPAPGRSR